MSTLEVLGLVAFGWFGLSLLFLGAWHLMQSDQEELSMNKRLNQIVSEWRK